MSRKYSEGRIKQALKNSRGNHLKAQQQIIAWTFEDHKFLYELVQPHLKGITAHAISYVERHMSEPEPIPAPEVDIADNTFGRELLQAIADGNPARFGQENAAAPVGRTHASQQHINALRAIAAKSKQTPKPKPSKK